METIFGQIWHFENSISQIAAKFSIVLSAIQQQ